MPDPTRNAMQTGVEMQRSKLVANGISKAEKSNINELRQLFLNIIYYYYYYYQCTSLENFCSRVRALPSKLSTSMKFARMKKANKNE